MVDHTVIRQAMRTRLAALVVASTGSAALSATATGYARQVGSFLDDKFFAGMEVMPAGFANLVPGVVTYVSALELRIAGGRTIEAEVGGRSLTVGLPRVRSLENSPVTDNGVPTADGEAVPSRPYFDEQYVPGPQVLGSIGPNGRLFAEPLYMPRIFVPEGLGDEAPARYAQAMLALFPPGDVIPIDASNSIHVRGNPAPFPGQILPNGKGHAGILCTLPLRCHSLNTI